MDSLALSIRICVSSDLMNSVLFIGGRIIDPANDLDAAGDLLVRDGKIAAVGSTAAAKAPPKTPRVRVKGLVVCPGLIDMHVHLREPGQTAKETIATGTAAAAAGGFTSVVCMPNTVPAIDNASTVTHVREIAIRNGKVNVFVTGAITKGLAGEELAPVGSLKQAGVVAVTDDGHCVQNSEMMRRAAEYAKMFDLPLLDHCQDAGLVTDGVMHEGYWSTLLGLRGWPSVGEETVVARNILLAELTGSPIHCQHISAAKSVELLREAKKRGVPISGETCPHYFTLTDAAIAGSEAFWKSDGQAFADRFIGQGTKPVWPNYDTHFKMNPPVRTAADREAVIAGLADGTLEVIASDHAPHCNFEKEVEFDYAPFGIIGLETELGMSMTQLFQTQRLGLKALIATLTSNPARLLRLAKGTLSVGADADITVIDPDREWTYDRSQSVSKSVNSPFFGWPMKGKAVATWVGGKLVWEEK
jgi:dihydroorotase